MVKKTLLGLLFGLTSSFCFGAVMGVNQFSGLDSQDNPAALQPSQSQDLLNVRLQPGGKSVYKRDGYGLFQSLNSISTATVHGGYHFQQSGGSDVQLWGSDIGLYASVNDSSFVRIATGTVGATWQCTDNLGFAYCVTSSNDTPVKTDGSAANTSYQPSIPAGSIITSTPLQLVVGGVSGNASSIYVSANNNFTNFTTGPLPTDPYIEIINSPGSRITHLGYYFGNLYWWKDQSLGYVSGSASQASVGITIISNQIGTIDNSSAFWNPNTYDQGNKFNSGAQATSSGNPYFNEMSSLGGIFFRGQDNHIYQYDGYTLTRLSRIITPTIKASSRRKANSWTQTTGSDFNTGSKVPSVNISTSISPGDVTVSSFSASETLTLSSMTFNSQNVNNASFESGQSTNWTVNSGWANTGSDVADTCTLSPQDGSFFEFGRAAVKSFSASVVSALNNSTVYSSMTITNATIDCSWTQQTLNVSGYQGSIAQLLFTYATGNNLLSEAFVLNGNSVTFYTATPKHAISCSGGGSCGDVAVDLIGGSPKASSETFTSATTYDTGFTSSTFQVQISSNLTNAVVFAVNTSTANPAVTTTILTSTGTNAIGNRYVTYKTTYSLTLADYPFTSITNTILSRSTGTYYSAVNNAPSLSSWGSFNADDSYPGISSITYYSRSSTNSFTVLSSTPSWIAQTKNSAVSTSTGTYMQLRADFYLSAATETPTLNDFTFNWFEGTANDKAYIGYFQDAIWFSVSSSSSVSTNNTIFYLDLLNNTWLKDNIPANGFLIENNDLYLGDPLSSKVYKFGGVTTDKGSAIQSYWKSMDFTGQDPTVQNDYDQMDFAFAESSNTVSLVWTIDQSTTITRTISIPLFSSKSTILKRGFALSPVAIGTYFNFQIGDNSSLSSWTLMGERTTYNPLPWRPQVAN